MTCLVFGAGGALTANDGSSDVAQARNMYRRTNYTGVIQLLQPSARENSAACELVGQSYLMLGEYVKATDYLEKAVALDPSQSSYYLFLGRAYGRRAETSFPVSAAHYASKARVNFEKALALSPNDPEVTGDLFEYYLQAPGFLGGGFDKAAVLAESISKRDAAEGVVARARLAEERKDYSTAEAMLRRALELAPLRPGRWVDLAKFLAKRGRYEESDAMFVEARKFAPDAPRVLFHEASTYIKENRKPEQARELLQQYLASSTVGPDDPSRQEARKLLKKVSGS